MRFKAVHERARALALFRRFFWSFAVMMAAHGFATTEVPVRAAVDVNALVDGRTALHQAAFMGDLVLIRALLDAGADPAVVDAQHGTTPAGWAQWARQDEAERLLRQAEAERSGGGSPTAYDGRDRAQG